MSDHRKQATRNPARWSGRLLASLEHKTLRRIARKYGLETQGLNRDELVESLQSMKPKSPDNTE